MARVCVLLMMSCLANQAIADAGQPDQRADLQVGGLLRIIEREAASAATALEEHAEEQEAMAPSDGGAPPSSGVFDINDQTQDDLQQDQAEVPSLAYPLTGSVSVGIGYSFIEAEDLVTDRAVEGIVDVDHQSHHLLFRAYWHFGFFLT